MGITKRMLLEQMEAEAKRCSECGKDDAYDPETIGDEAQVSCLCGVFEWWCEKHFHGYNGDCCDACLDEAVEKD